MPRVSPPRPIARRATPAALVALIWLAALAVVAACTTIVGVGTPCDSNADCDGTTCEKGFCSLTPVVPEPGEGEGDVVGEGEAGEGEAGEGEAGEGEGDGGEGEGDAGEGEGEGDLPPPPPRTCLDLLTQFPDTPTGDYALDVDGDGVADAGTFHCDMSTDGGGFTRVALIDAESIGTVGCPGDWRLVDHRADALGFIGCSRQLAGAGVVTAGVAAPFAYTDVIGSVEAVVFGDDDAFADAANIDENNIDDFYVDGVSVTTAAPRQHVWTFASGHPIDPDTSVAACPCVGGAAQPAFVGQDFFCDKPSPAARAGGGRFFDPSDPQWDGADNICEPAAQTAGDPFFHRDALFASPTQEDLELRIMSDQGAADEDTAVTHVELYIR